jgi:acyl-CoA synthetase (AMP-forming)/AMP-acid ligase II
MPFPDFPPTVPNLLHSSAKKFGAHDYLVVGHDRLSYQEAESRSAALARGLLAEGIGKGSRVGLLMPNSVEFAVAAFALARIGAIFVPVNTFNQTRELGWTIRHADLTHLIACPHFLKADYLDRLETAFPALPGQRADGPLFLPEAPFLRVIYVLGDSDRTWSRGGEASIVTAGERAGIDEAYLSAVESCVVPADPVVIVYSSGSTGDPSPASRPRRTGDSCRARRSSPTASACPGGTRHPGCAGWSRCSGRAPNPERPGCALTEQPGPCLKADDARLRARGQPHGNGRLSGWKIASCLT